MLAVEFTVVTYDRRGDAVEHFQMGIGVPDEITAAIRRSPSWPALESLAHTLVYDTVVTDSMPAERLATIMTPTLVLNSSGTDARLDRWARRVAAALPNGSHRRLPGERHGVPPEDLLPVLTEFFLGS